MTQGTPRYSAFTKRFFPRLPKIVRNDVKRKIAKRKQRQNPTKENLILAAEDAVKFGLKRAHFIEDKFPFVDSRAKTRTQPLSHNILMRDDAVSELAKSSLISVRYCLPKKANPKYSKAF